MADNERSSRIGEPAQASDDDRVEAVLRVLRGVDRLTVARDLGLEIELLEEWTRVFLQAGREGLRRPREPLDDVERLRAWARLGQLTMRVDLLERFLVRKGYADELRSLKGVDRCTEG